MGSPAVLINRYSVAEDREGEGNEDWLPQPAETGAEGNHRHRNLKL